MSTNGVQTGGNSMSNGANNLISELDLMCGLFAAYYKYRRTGVETPESKVINEMLEADRESMFDNVMKMVDKSDKIRKLITPKAEEEETDATPKVKNIQEYALNKKRQG